MSFFDLFKIKTSETNVEKGNNVKENSQLEEEENILVFNYNNSDIDNDYEAYSDSFIFTGVDNNNNNDNDEILGIDKNTILNIQSDATITLEDGFSISVSDYINHILSQNVGFKTEEEYQEYIIDKLSANLEEMKATYQTQEDSDGFFSNLYDGAKELLGLGTSSSDVEDSISQYETIINALTQAMNGKGDMSFEEAYEYYTGTSFSTEKIDNYINASNMYSAIMVGLQYDDEYLEKFENGTGISADEVMKSYAQCQLDTFGESSNVKDIVDTYSQDQESYSDKLSSIISTVGLTCTVVGAITSFFFPPAGIALMNAGKGIALAGMFVDNAIDLVDNATDKEGLTKEELGNLALETGVEAVSYISGRKIGGFTNGLNDLVSSKAVEAGAGKIASYIAGQTAETVADTVLSLGADYAITQGQSLITTGEFMDSDEYWSLDRFLGEGKNQLIGILTGLSSSKISAYQQSVITTAQNKINSGDIEGAKSYLKKSGMKMSDSSFDDFTKSVQEVDLQVKTQTTETIDIDETKVQTEQTLAKTETLKLEAGNTDTDADGTANKNQTIVFLGKEYELDKEFLSHFRDENNNIDTQKFCQSGGITRKFSLVGITKNLQSWSEIKTSNPEKYNLLSDVLKNITIHNKTAEGVSGEYKTNFLNELAQTDEVLLKTIIENNITIDIYDDNSLYGRYQLNAETGKLEYETISHAAYSGGANKVIFSERCKNGEIIVNGGIIQKTFQSIAHEFGHAYDYKTSSKELGLQGEVWGNDDTTKNADNSTNNKYFRFSDLISHSKEFDEAITKDLTRIIEIDDGKTFDELLQDNHFAYYFGKQGKTWDDTSGRKELFAQMVSYATTGKVSDSVFSERVEELFPTMLEFTKNVLNGEDVQSGIFKFSDSKLSPGENQQLSSNAVELNATYKEHIGEVEAETKSRFSDLKTVKDENITARAKGDKSIFEKLASKFNAQKLTSTDIADCSKAIGDAYGTRIQMNSIDTEAAKTTIVKALTGKNIEYNDFVEYVTNVKYDEQTKKYVNSNTGIAVDQDLAIRIESIKYSILDTLKAEQSGEVVNRIIDIINNADPNNPPVITELNNYGSAISSYFTDAQLQKIANAYKDKYKKQLDIVTKLDTKNLPEGKYSIDDEYVSKVVNKNAIYTDKGAEKASGYTSSQMNTKHKLSDGTVGNGELQIRGTEVNAFADVEHIPYDIRQGKIKENDTKYSGIYSLIKGMNASTYKAYNEYLTAVYDSLRLKELGIPVTNEPKIETYLKNSGLSDNQLELLSRTGLEKLH